jgi:hypothetical protein
LQKSITTVMDTNDSEVDEISKISKEWL